MRSFNLEDCRHVNASPLACIVPDDQRLEFFDVRPADRKPLPVGKENRKGDEFFARTKVVEGGLSESFFQNLGLLVVGVWALKGDRVAQRLAGPRRSIGVPAIPP